MKRDNRKPNNKQEVHSDINSKQSSLISIFGKLPGNTIVSSARATTVGGSADATEFHVAHGVCDLTRILFDSTAETLITGQLANVISAYGSVRGYTPQVTAANIADYWQRSAVLYAQFLTIYRLENLRQLKNYDGASIASMFLQRNVFETSNNAIITDILTSDVPTVLSHSGGYSNNAWSTEFLSYLPLIRMPQSWYEFITSLFLPVHDITQSGNQVFLHFFENTDYSTANLQTGFNNSVAALQALLAGARDLVAILDLMEIPKSLAVEQTWQRDRNQETLIVAKDPVMHELLYNGKLADLWYGSTSEDTDVRRLIALPVSSEHLFVQNYTLELPANFTAIYALLNRSYVLGNALRINHAVRRYAKVAGMTNMAIIPAGVFTPLADDASGATAAQQIVRISLAASRWSFIFPRGLPYIPHVNYTIAAGIYTTSNLIDTLVSETGNSWNLPDDFDIYQDYIQLDLLFGRDWRSALQSFLDKLNTPDYTGRQTSN